jgi:hypothetical protein
MEYARAELQLDLSFDSRQDVICGASLSLIPENHTLNASIKLIVGLSTTEMENKK